jgi:hypothetical protein
LIKISFLKNQTYYLKIKPFLIKLDFYLFLS